MLNEQTKDKLVMLKLYEMASAFAEYCESRQPDELTFAERLGLMLEREWTARQEKRLKKRLSDAKLREQACMEDINYRHPRQLDRSVMQKLATCQWIRKHENVIITGHTGLGKSWIACALANQACREGFTAVYGRVPRILQQLAIARADGSYAKALSRLARTDIIILDDWGLAPLGDYERRDMLEIIEDRHGLKSTIVTSQLPVKKWHDTIGDPSIADALLDRLVHSAHRIELKGPSMRDPQQPEASK